LEFYDRQAALEAAAGHAAHFLEARQKQIDKLTAILDRPPVVVSPYDAELFGHWWFEGPDFLDGLFRRANLQHQVKLITPGDYLRLETTNQLATPAASSWGEEGYWRVWLNDANQWIYPHLAMAQERMAELARGYPSPTPLHARALRQAGRELLLAQASDWAFIIRTGTSPDYARKRILEHLSSFAQLYEQLKPGGVVNEAALGELEAKDNLFPDLDYRHWAG
jgi:1,4-alpha-glucan branching enzyme